MQKLIIDHETGKPLFNVQQRINIKNITPLPQKSQQHHIFNDDLLALFVIVLIILVTSLFID